MIAESFNKNKKGIYLMIISSFSICIGQFFWKLSTDGCIGYLISGFALYGIGALIMIIAYKFGSLSVLQPILSINYAISLLIGHFILSEELSKTNIIGVFIIIVGVILIAGGD
ncbi:EamA family transporter [Bacteroides fragilis]|jgi:drug/metabolite transporter (DMT)-like permease|uniref:EamA family transporter n=1 Tax=Bacteroides fragilis TaxID=817 RepID=UPI001F5C794A|nr:EamA family transporter [Bacteroides fragilis]